MESEKDTRSMKGYTKTRALRGVTFSLFLLASLCSIVCLGLSVHLLTNQGSSSSSSSSSSATDPNILTSLHFSPGIKLEVTNTTATSTFINTPHHHIIAKMGGTIGLSGMGIFIPSAVWAFLKSGLDVHLNRGTPFRRWQGAIIWLASSAIISVSSALVSKHHVNMHGFKLGIVILSFLIGIFSQIVSIMIIYKPTRRRYSLSSSASSQYSIDSNAINDEKWAGNSSDSCPRLDVPILRSQSVTRKQVNYMAYLFDDQYYYNEKDFDDDKTESGYEEGIPKAKSLFEFYGNGSNSTIHDTVIPKYPNSPAISRPPVVKRASIHSQKVHFQNGGGAAGRTRSGSSHRLSTPL